MQKNRTKQDEHKMLLDFRFGNFRSFRDEQTFSMVPNKGSRNVHKTGSSYIADALKACAIYGPNGSGKTNVIRALTFVSDLVENSAKKDSTEKISLKAFAFDGGRDKPTTFEITFVGHEDIWRFGFSVQNGAIIEEWLYRRSLTTSRERRVYGRDINGIVEPINRALNSYRDILKTKTSSNQLFLSKLAQNNDESTLSAFVWLAYNLRPISTLSDFPKAVTARKLISPNTPAEGNAVLRIMQAAGIDVDRIEVETVEIPEGDFLKYANPSDLVIGGSQKEDYFTLFNIKFVRKGKNGEEVRIDFSDESLGTHNIFALAGIIVDAMQVGFVVVVDELNQTFHSDVLKLILELFSSDEANASNAQLIFTSHDAHIMSSLDRDQIWIVDKAGDHSSYLYSIADMGLTRQGGPRRQGAFGKQYLENKFGGLPRTDIISAIEAVSKSNAEHLNSV